MSASCTHVSALLHALTALTPTSFQLQPNFPTISDNEDEPTPVTSLPCQWKPPKARKDSTLPIASTSFEKFDYRKPVKRKIKLVEDFDPRPTGQIQSRMPVFLEKIKGEELAVSFLLDPALQQARPSHIPSDIPVNVDDQGLSVTIAAFKETLKVTADKAREIERNT